MRRPVHAEQRREDRDERQRVDREAHRLARHRQHEARERRSDHARAVDHHRVERDRVRQVGAVADEMDVGRLAQHDVEHLHDGQEQRERDQVRDGHDAEERDHRERRRLQHQQRLRQEQRAPPVDAIHHHAGERAEEQHPGIAGERDDAQQERGAGEPPREPAHRDLLRPGPDQREPLADEEQPVVAVPERAERAPRALDQAFHGWRSPRSALRAPLQRGPGVRRLKSGRRRSTWSRRGACRRRSGRAGGRDRRRRRASPGARA